MKKDARQKYFFLRDLCSFLFFSPNVMDAELDFIDMFIAVFNTAVKLVNSNFRIYINIL